MRVTIVSQFGRESISSDTQRKKPSALSATKRGGKAYAKYTPPQEVWDKARKLSDSEVKEKVKASKKFVAQTYDKAGLDPSMPHKPQ